MIRFFRRFLPALTLLGTALTARAVTDLTWDPGTTDPGTQIYTHPNTAAGQFQFHIVTEASVQGAWRTALRVTAGEATLYLRQGAEATPTEYTKMSAHAGSDGLVLAPGEFGAGQDWYILVAASAGAQWSLVSGEVYVQDLGVLPFTDANSNSVYDIGEAMGAGGVGPVTIGAEGARFFKASAPTGTPAWSLWLNGLAKDIAVRKAQVPVGGVQDAVQNGRMLLVPPYLDTGTVFIGVTGNPGQSITLDSRIQAVQDIGFDTVQTAVSLSGVPYRLYRTTVPPNLLGWDVSATPTVGDVNVAVRRDVAASENFNDAYSEVAGSAVDGVTLVPPSLTDGTWFITVHAPAVATFTLRNAEPTTTPIAFTDTKVNSQPLRVGWRYFALTDIPSQLGKLGWQLELSAQISGTEIALRRGSLPGRWTGRSGGLSFPSGYADFSSVTGRLDRPNHQADVWYAGIYYGAAPLGSFTLNTREIPAAPMTFDVASATVTGQDATEWRWWRVDVPATAGLLGWGLKLTNVSSGKPGVVVRRGSLPDTVGSGGWGYSASGYTTWPQGNYWTQQRDFTNREADEADQSWRWRQMVIPMGRPLEPGTYYVGVGSTEGTAPMSYTLESRGIGSGFAVAVTDRGSAATPSSQAITALAARAQRFFKFNVPAGMRSWELTLTPSAGDLTMTVRRGTLPAPENYDNVDNLAGKQSAKGGTERLVVLPRAGQDFVDEGDYYVAVASAGTGGALGRIGSGTASGTLSNSGALLQTDLGTATAGGLSVPVTLGGGQMKAFRVLAPAGTISLEARIEGVTGAAAVALIQGQRLPMPYTNTGYGFDFGETSGTERSTDTVTIPAAAAGEYRVVVNAIYDGTYPASSATLVVTARPAPTVTFNGGTSAVTAHPAHGWRFFRVDVPAGVLGWDLQIANLTGQTPPNYPPAIMVCRDVMTTAFGTTVNFGSGSLSWPSGYRWSQRDDYTWKVYDADGNHPDYRHFTAAMGRPLEPGSYFVAVYNAGDLEVGYTLESRGIGAGQQRPVTTLAFAGGASTVTDLPARQVAYFKVTVPASTRSWEMKVEPTAGDLLLVVRQGTIPDAGGGDAFSYGGARVAKPEGERFVLLPARGEDFLPPGDYYLALVSEGVGAENVTIGTGNASGTVTSIGPLTPVNLGNATSTPTGVPVALLSGQAKAYQITVPAGAASLDVELEVTDGSAVISAAPGLRLPESYGTPYGWTNGEVNVVSGNTFHITSPTAGVWSFLVRATHHTFSTPWPAADAVLHASIAAGPESVAFDGGSFNVAGQAAETWRFFQVTVPPGVLGWDLRLVNVTGGSPRMAVRRGHLPEHLGGSGFFQSYDTWPDGATRSGWLNLTQRRAEQDGRLTDGQFMVAAMGSPLEPGTYFVGVTNAQSATAPMSYTLESRGIGAGQSFPVTTLALNGSQPIPATAARMARFFKVAIPANTPSWEVTLAPTDGDLCLGIRKDVIPDLESYGSVYSGGGQFKQQSDGERFVLLPKSNQAFLEPGDYYIAAVSEGANPGVPTVDTIGSGTSAGTLTSAAPLGVAPLGTAANAGTNVPVTLASGQLKAYQFTVPPGAPGLEVRLDNRVGNPGVHLLAGTALPRSGYYAAEGGVPAFDSPRVISVASPAAGTWTVTVDTEGDFALPTPASATLAIRLLQPQRLNFSSAENGNGFSHTVSGSLLAGQRLFYEVPVPATFNGGPIDGWWLKFDVSAATASLRVLDQPDFASPNAVASNYGEDIVMARPYFDSNRTWWVEVRALVATTFTLTSQPTVLNHAAYTMPTTPGVTFADTGTGLPGDQGIDLADDAWHFYAFDVPAGNGALVRAELRALNGNPDLFLRAGGVPTQSHDATGPADFLGESLVHYGLTGNGTQYGNWTPLNGRLQSELAPGRWYAAVHAAPGSNARYRLLLSTGTVQTLALGGGSVTAQNLAPFDVRYYRFTVPLDAPVNWQLTLAETIGNVRLFIRDTIPPGDEAFQGTFGYAPLVDWSHDLKNQGPYPNFDASGTHTLAVPPLRPGSTYFVGVQSANTAQFSLSSAVAGGTIGTSPVLDFYAGSIGTTLAAGERRRYRVPVPADALRWKHSAVHDGSVLLFVEQGTVPQETGAHYFSGGADTSLNRELLPTNWPWVAGRDFYLLVANTSGSPQPFSLTMDGRNATTEDEDHDGLADPWERAHFGDLSRNGSGDLNNDGLSDAASYALGVDPGGSQPMATPAATITTDASPELAIDLPLPPTIPPQARIDVYGADDLGGVGTLIAQRPAGSASWTGDVTPIPGGVRIRDTQAFASHTRRFLWLTVTLVPEP